jgi:hypothetical protein
VPPSPEKVTIRDTPQPAPEQAAVYRPAVVLLLRVPQRGGRAVHLLLYQLGRRQPADGDWRDGDCAAVLCLVAPMLTRRMQKRKLFMILCGLDVAVRVVMWFVGYQQVTMLFILQA